MLPIHNQDQVRALRGQGKLAAVTNLDGFKVELDQLRWKSLFGFCTILHINFNTIR